MWDAELANEYGNLASRTLAMVQHYRDGVVPAVSRDPALDVDLEGLPAEVAALMDRAEPTQALDRIWQRVRRLNRYVEERAPWRLARSMGGLEARSSRGGEHAIPRVSARVRLQRSSWG